MEKEAGAVILAMVAAVLLMLCQAVSGQSSWTAGATATFYGGSDAGGTNSGACGYGNQLALYGTVTTALSTAFFENGVNCGACFEIRCTGSNYCYSGKTVTVSATNLCPHGSNGGWCDGYKNHFDLSQPAFIQVAQEIAGHFPAEYRRVPCVRSGGVRFTINGNTYWNLVLIQNVAGAGVVKAVQIKGSGTGWISMSRNWGENWECATKLSGQSVSFQLTLDDGTTKIFPDVAPRSWALGQSFASSTNF